MKSLKNFIVIFLVISWNSSLYAQFSDNFSDGNYLTSPFWFGDTSKFDVNPSNELWLNAPALTDIAYLSLVSQSINNALWEFRVRLDFNPSSSNLARIYLVSDQQNLKQPLHGYYVEVGNTQDDISLFVQDGLTVTKIIDGTDGILNTTLVNSMIRVTRDNLGNWELFADTSGGNSYVSLGTVNDLQFTQGYYFGVQCRYTATRSDKMFFDDFNVTGSSAIDVTSPFISNVQISGSNNVAIQFSEPVELLTAQITSNYTANNGLGNPISAIRDTNDISTVILTFSGTILPSVSYQLFITQVEDFQLNPIQDTTIIFADYTPLAGDIVINEIMADPDPVVGLPNAEYIELFNRTSFPISLDGWKLICGSTTKTLPNYTLPPDSFVIVTDQNNLTLFTGISGIGVSTFPTLTNSGMSIRLKNVLNITIDSVFYNDDWYGNDLQDDGGYSLERINPSEFCAESINWTASQNGNGGTPGYENSVFNTLLLPTTIISDVIDSASVQLIFSKSLDTSTVDVSDFVFDCGLTVTSFQFISSSEIILLLNNNLPVNSSCMLNVGTLSDCSGNSVSISNISVTYYLPAPFDIIISEIMVDESPVVLLPENEYLELHNRQTFPINLKNWILVNNGTNYVLPDTVIEPSSYLAVMEANDIFYFSGIPLCGLNSFPSFTNTFGTIELRYKDSTLVHAISYSDDWYKNPGKEDGGWSLEMIDLSKPCLGEINWKASENSSGGTPGMVNSVNGNTIDSISPFLYRTGVIYPDTIILYSYEAIDPNLSLSSFSIDHGLTFLSISVSEPDIKKIYLKTNAPLQADTLYTIIATNSINDCAGNMSAIDTLYVKLPVAFNSGDILINEVLSNPNEGGVDYVEIYNHSGNVIDLSNVFIANGDTLTMFIDNAKQVSQTSLLFFPGEYILLSESQEKVKPFYTIKNLKAFVDIEGFPSYSNDEGTVAIADLSQNIIDIFAYNEGMHFSLLNSTEGVSLERLFVSENSNDPMNWHSAAQDAGFGTPGYINSQFQMSGSTFDNTFHLDYDIISPDNDGYQDVLTIRYQLDEPGSMATIQIHDANGREVRKLINNELLGTEGFFVWDGLDNDGNKARTGIHILFIDLFTANGNNIRIKKVCVVASKL